ncbi:2-dehydropantoate 2-reductase [Enterococcus viikkiensis]|uniref:2-dehydropantoate 2-reductase n=1 Tax=Enterococcus viikkiensis TaxID=930854 RepID=UPI0010F7EBD2|nr:2-dehydropantoate 2-reductase [Enterococcus viikkiensis]
MRIAIAGAGAMGSRIGLMLHEAGNEVLLIDRWPEHIEAIRKNGLIGDFDDRKIVAQLPIYSPEEIIEEHETVDLIVALTKSMQLEQMFHDIQPIIGSKTFVFCLLNGLGHEETLAKFVPEENIIFGTTTWTAGLAGPGHAKLAGSGSIEMENLAPSGKAFTLEVLEVFQKAQLNPIYSQNVRYSIWKKACINGTLNGLCTILDCNIAEFGSLTVAREIIEALVAEFVAVAEAERIHLDHTEMIDAIEATYDPKTQGLHFPSMYQDLIRNQRKTEIDYINGAVWKKGQLAGIHTPYCAFLTQLIHGKEELLKAK